MNTSDYARQLLGLKENEKPVLPQYNPIATARLEAVKAATVTMGDMYHKYKDFQLEFLWENFIVKRANNFLTAEGGTGKTRMGIALAVAAKYGLDSYLGNRLSIDGNVLYLNYEITEPLFKVIAEPIELHLKAANPTQWREAYVLNYLNNPRLTIEDAAIAIEHCNVKFIIIDSFKACISRLMREKKQKELNNLNADIYFDVLNHWRDKYNVTTLTINHTNKGLKNQRTSGDLGFGPSSVRDFMDYQVFLRYAYDTDRPERLLVVDKARFMEKGNCNKLIKMGSDPRGYFYFELLEDAIRETDFINEEKTQHPKTEQIIEMLEAGASYPKIKSTLSVSDRVISAVKKQWKEEKGSAGRGEEREEQEEECPF